MKILPRTEFTENFVRLNGFEKEFSEWYYKKGMGFQDRMKWWGDEGQRKTPHEGIDLCCFKDRQKSIKFLDSRTLIPPLMEGTVISIFPDFLGESILFRHAVLAQGFQLCSIFGHIIPAKGLVPGKILDQMDQPVARVSFRENGSRVPGHLHISLFWSVVDFSLAGIDWSTIHSSAKIIFLDPDEII